MSYIKSALSYGKTMRAAALIFFLFITSLATAQPGGNFGGGRPAGPPPGSRGNRPSMSDRERMRKQWQQQQAAEKAQQVRQKKTVREGDVFKVIGTLQDSVSGEAVPFVSIAILSAADSSIVRGGISDVNGYFEQRSQR